MAEGNLQIQGVHSLTEIECIASLAKEIWTQHYTPIIGSEQVVYMLDKFQSTDAIADQLKTGYQYFLLNDGSPCGYLGLKSEDTALFISKIYVKAEKRGLGYGKKMIQFVVDHAHEKGLTTLRLTVNKYNSKTIKAYQKMGFIKHREVVFDIGNGYIMDDFEMMLML